jgi:hypothetical protein
LPNTLDSNRKICEMKTTLKKLAVNKICAVAFALLAAVPVSAQKITEYGKPDELRGVSKVFISLVYGGSVELKDRDRIIKEIEKGKKKHKISTLEVVDRMEDAEVILIYSEAVEGEITGATTTRTASGSRTTIGERDRWTGKGIVVKPLPNGNQRLIMDSSSSQVSFLQNAPATSFGSAFMKAYVKANPDLSGTRK